MDGRRFIETVFTNQKAQSITQVVMNLPKDAAEFLGMQSHIRYICCFPTLLLAYHSLKVVLW